MTVQELELIKEEYRRLSQEIGSALNHRLQIIQFGLTFVGVLVGFALTTAESVSAIVLAIMIPATCTMILSLWLSEVRRTRRASWYLFGLERRVNNELKSRALRWEEDIRGKRFDNLTVFRLHYYTTASFFILIAIFASIYGTWLWVDLQPILRIGWPLAFGIGITSIVGFVLNRLRRYDFADKSWPEMISERQMHTGGKNELSAQQSGKQIDKYAVRKRAIHKTIKH